MKCMSPIRILDKHYSGMSCNDYNSYSKKYKIVPCGYCPACRMNKAQQWAVRLMDEKRFWNDAVFLTLTYNNENLPECGTLVKEDLQKFNKRLRINLDRHYKFNVPLKIFGCGEYGGKFHRPHYHEIIMGLSDVPEIRSILDKSWKLGFWYLGDVSHQSCQYVASYTLKKQYGQKGKYYEEKGIIPEFVLVSKGIGEQYVKKYKDILKRDDFVLFKTSSGSFVRVPLPRYYVDKVYSDEDSKVTYKNMRKEAVRSSRRDLEKRTGLSGFDLDDYEKEHNEQRKVNFETLTRMKGKK